MSAFDNLTLGEVEDIETQCLGGKPFTEADPLKLAGAVMWATIRKQQGTQISWDDFRYQTSMADVRKFGETEMRDEDDNPKGVS